MTMRIILVAAWGILGGINLCGKQVSKFDYALVWSLLMVNLIGNCLGV